MSSEQAHEEGWVVKFIPFCSAVDSPFWVQYCQEKLENIQLNEDPIPIKTSYGIDGPPRLQCQESSLRPSTIVPNERVAVSGSLLGFNTLETFQKLDKNKLLIDNFCPKFLEGDLSCLTNVIILTYPDLKNHKVLYWFGNPALLTRNGRPIRAVQQDRLGNVWSEEDCQILSRQLALLRQESALVNDFSGLPPFFVRTKEKCELLGAECLNRLGSGGASVNMEDVIFGFFDPSGPTTLQSEQPVGWPMRNLVAYLCFHLNLGGKSVQVLSYRPKIVRRISAHDSPSDDLSLLDGEDSVLMHVLIPTKEDYEWDAAAADDSSSSPPPPSSQYRAVGWELNARNKPGPRWVNLRPLLDSQHLAIQAADLNLKLMKWRMIPDLNVELLQSTKVLILGAGTLGCSVARTLLGWGVRHLKIVDNGKVSYSNPVRQSLFTLQDCQDDNGAGRQKAVAASDALKTIAADVQSEGIILSIPMPGHAESKEALEISVTALDTLVKECDVVFLLTDTRESRWLPTIMAAAHDKMLINAALGLDSWLVMRHGAGVSSSASTTRLGCYFCNDVVAPENSTKNRTLDQQCTVARPGLAPIASSMAVELMVSLLHHPMRHAAAAPPSSGSANFSPTTSDSTASPLGVMPHQIRGSLVSYTMMKPAVPAFKCCTGCSAGTVEAYLKDKVELVYEACQSRDGSYLETLSGLTAFRAEAAEKLAEMENWEDDDEDEDVAL
jgi:ubiquitin-like modifier-activating enzyme ATG7